MKALVTCVFGWLLTAAPALAQAAQSHGAEEASGGSHGVAAFLFELVTLLLVA
jgi:hypothetical protein